MQRTAANLRVEGVVQGVGYRWWAIGAAERLGLSGWARNRTDGTVEILAIGAPESIDALERACATGPAASRVAAVRRSPADDDGSRGFRQKPTV